MSPPAIWPPHSSEQIFEAGIRTRCHAYLNEEAGSSPPPDFTGPRRAEAAGAHACGRPWRGRGEGGRPRHGGPLEPTYTLVAEKPWVKADLG